MKKSRKNIASIITYIVVVLLVVAFVVFAVRYYDDVDSMFDEDYISFAVSIDDAAFTTAEYSDTVFSFDQELKFSVGYDWARFATGKDTSYSVKVVPCRDFDFTVDGNAFSFLAEEDLTAAFNVKVYSDYFTMTVPSSIVTVLQSIYPAGEIVVPDLDVALDYYTLIVTASDGAEVKVSFKYFSLVEGVSIEPATLEF